MKPSLVAQPFEIEGKAVRIVTFEDWRADKEYADAEARGIVEVHLVTWSDDPKLVAGWLGDIQQQRDGSWLVGDATDGLAYASSEAAAMQVVLSWLAYKKTLSAADLERLAAKIIPAVAMPGVKPPPTTERNAQLKRRLMR